jgi:hypothetical protein
LVAQCEVADFWVVERFVSAGMTMYVVAAPQAGEFRAFEDQLADDRGQIGRVGSRPERARRWVTQTRSWASQSSNRVRAVGWRKV